MDKPNRNTDLGGAARNEIAVMGRMLPQRE
jgi:hypothetical protein